MPYVLERSQLLARPVDEVFRFFSCAQNLQAITPSWLSFRILRVSSEQIRQGTRIDYALRWRALPLRWTTEIIVWEPPLRFVDLQVSGPYRQWHHEHRFEADGNRTIMTDRVTYTLPFGAIGRLAHFLLVGHDVRRIFAYRSIEIERLFQPLV